MFANIASNLLAKLVPTPLQARFSSLTTQKALDILNGLEAEQEAEQLSRRANLRAEHDALMATDLEDVRATQLLVDAALAEERAAEQIWRDKQAVRVEIQRARNARAYTASKTRDRLDMELRRTASPLIHEARERARDLIPETYKQRDQIKERTIDGGYLVAWSNSASIHARVEAISDAIRAIEGLYAEPVDDASLQARIDAILNGLPEVESRPARFFEAFA